MTKQGCYALAIDNDHACELHLFGSEEERDSFMWNYAFENTGTEAQTLDEFQIVYGGDLGEAMQATNYGWHTDERMIPVVTAPDHASDTVDALVQAESFISGFEDDETQEGIADMLAGLRAAIARERAKPDLLSALRALAYPLNSVERDIALERAVALLAEIDGMRS